MLFRKREHPFSRKGRSLTACTSCSFPLSCLSVMDDLRVFSGENTRVAAAGLVGSLRSEETIAYVCLEISRSEIVLLRYGCPQADCTTKTPWYVIRFIINVNKSDVCAFNSLLWAVARRKRPGWMCINGPLAPWHSSISRMGTIS